MSENKWRFNGNGGGKINGLETADINTFLKDSLASLAREIAQNSIDAKDPDISGPAKLEFHPFTMKTKDIPGIDRLKKEVSNCYEYWKDNDANGKPLANMKKLFEEEEVFCLRISDFNTTGLIGVSDFRDPRSPWYSLLHGSGMSDKVGGTGGSKGIGKYATFANSAIRTVFYVTHTKNNEIGYEGMAYLCSAPLEGSTKNEFTEGLGYFGSDDINNSILENFNLDADFHGRDNNENGTDIYILGFLDNKNWKGDIISKILDSFMAAIIRERLEVVVDDITINKDNLDAIVYNDALLTTNKKSVLSQYILLGTKEDVNIDKLDISYFGRKVGTVTLYSKVFEGTEQQYATGKCVMIRYPYMKIKDSRKLISDSMSVSAVCIIEDDELNRLLKNIENPQHTDWEVRRINDTDERNGMKNIISDMEAQIKATLSRHVENSNTNLKNEIIANEFLPANTKGDGASNKEGTVPTKVEKIQITPHKNKVRTTEPNTNQNSVDGNGVGMDTISPDDEGPESTLPPNGHNNKKGGDPKPGDDGGKGKLDNKGSEGFVRTETKGISYRFICVNRNGTYALIFTHNETIKNCELELSVVDGSGEESRLPITSAINKNTGEALTVTDHITIQLDIIQNTKNVILFETAYKGLFAGLAHCYKVTKKEENN